MGNIQQREELHRTIWAMADDLRGQAGGWEFKAYVLGTLFYRFISENLTDYINKLQAEAGVEGFDYAAMSDEEAEEARDMMVTEKGFFILPSQLFQNVCKHCEQDENLNMTLAKVFKEIEGSAIGTASEDDMKGLFSDILANDANLSVSSYVEQEDTREVIDIKAVNAKLAELITEGEELNKKIETIIKELGA
jgi:type I restriction enzyme M protein